MRDYRALNYGLAKAYAAAVGLVLVAVGLLGFVANPIVSAAPGALFATNAVHNIVHIGTGALALYIAFGLDGDAQSNGVIAFGVLYAVIFAVVWVSPTFFGLFGDAPANAADHLLHLALAVVSLAVGYATRAGAERTAATS